MYLYFVNMNGFERSEEVVTESVLRVSCEMSILCITLTKDAMFEIAQILEHKYQSIESGDHSYVDGLHRSIIVNRGSSMIIVVNRLLFWLANFRLEEHTRDECTWITW